MENALKKSGSGSVEDCLKALKEEAFAIYYESISACRAIGKYGAELLRDGDTVLTHSNDGFFGAVECGAALSPVYNAKDSGKSIKVYVDETRPLLQGARITAYELTEAGIDTTVICDGMAPSLMQHKKINIIITGCDCVAANGDVVCTVGALSLAVNAKYYGVPFYVAFTGSTVDRNIPNGSGALNEQRDGREISDYWYSCPMVANKAKCDYDPAFDVVPRELISGYINENGIGKEI